MHMTEQLQRRAFLKKSATAGMLGALGVPGLVGAVAIGAPQDQPQLSPQEKEKLKRELQRELERKVTATLKALEHCNLHGTWESEPWEIEVV